MSQFAEIAFTPAVQELQQRHGSRAQYARLQQRGQDDAKLGEPEAELLAKADSFFLATVSETGWPYVQHRGGPRGFVKIVSPRRIAFADFRGNRQYISAGNAVHNDRAALIIVDYAERTRLKLFGHLRFIDVADADPALLRLVELPGYSAKIERVALIDVAAFNWNCPQHIPQRFSSEDIAEASVD